jgi:hypothetical protein
MIPGIRYFFCCGVFDGVFKKMGGFRWFLGGENVVNGW